MANCSDERLSDEFLSCFKTFDQTFFDLIPVDTVRTEFEDWLSVKLRYTRLMTEKAFIAYIINEDSNGFSGSFIK